MMTELDELKAKWEAHDRQLEKSLRLNRELLIASKLKPAESELRWLAIYSGLEATMWLVIVVVLGNFIAGHIRMPGLALSAVAVDVMSIGMLIALIRRMIGALHIDYRRPIAAIQNQVEGLRILRIRTTKWGVLFGTMLWVPWLAMVSLAIFGVDIYRSVDTAWVIVNVLFGLALCLAAIWASKKYGDRIDQSPFIQRLMKDLAGNNLNAARSFLATLREFERE
jgi:hypothetical protein